MSESKSAPINFQTDDYRSSPDAWLADILIHRLNVLLDSDPGVGQALFDVMQSRIAITGDGDVRDHPTIQVDVDDGVAYLGWLGILNGLVGVLPDGSQCGFIAAVVDKDRPDVIHRFQRFDRVVIEW